MATTGEVVRGVFTQHLLTKGVAVLVALALWWYVGYELTQQRPFRVDVTIELEEAQREEWRLLDKPTHQVQVEIEGPRQQIEQLGDQTGGFRWTVRIRSELLRGRTEDEITLPVRLSDQPFILPSRRLKVVSTDPPTLPLKLGRLGSEVMEVDAKDLAAKIPADLGDYQVTGVDVSPARVKVVGPVGALGRLRGKLPLEPIDVTGATTDVSQVAAIAASARDAFVTFASGAKRPTITVRVAPKPVQKVVRAHVDWVRHTPPEGFSLEEPLTDTIDVKLEGPRDVLETLGAEHVQVIAKMRSPLSVDEKGPSGNAAPVQAFVIGVPGVRVVEHRPSLDFRVIPAPRTGPPTPPNGTGSGSGEKPPGGGGDTQNPGSGG